MKLQLSILVATCMFAGLILGYCGHEQHKTRLAMEALVAATKGQRLVSTVYVLGIETQAITTIEPGELPDDLYQNHQALLLPTLR